MPKKEETPEPQEKMYGQVLPEITDWPIYKLSQQRQAIIAQVIKEVMAEFEGNSRKSRINTVADAYYQERKRMKETPWKVDPKDEKAFWGRIRSRLQHVAAQNAPESATNDLLREIITRYANEIAGDFSPRTYNFARRVLGFFFARIFSAATEGWFRGIWRAKLNLQAKMKLKGEVEQLRNLATKGTVLLVPTHFSNLDSVVVGWAVGQLGLPALTYGAGINLFGHPVLSHFMSRLGAFRVDRRKKNRVYLETLKVYTEYLLRNNGHMLFFPGGTRSRGGNIESKLKLGLLGTAIEAQRKLVLEKPDNPNKLFVVPLVIGYHTVLEAPSLIDEYLKQEGKEKYVLVKDDFRSIRKNIKFIWNFFKSPSEMVFSFGAAMDLFGNPLDVDGNSLDKQGNKIELKHYFTSAGKQNDDPQRNQAYTRLLGEEVLKRYYRENVVFSSHLVAFAALQILLKRHGGDIYQLLTISDEDLTIEKEEFYKVVERLHIRLRELERAEKVRLAEHMPADIRKMVEHGIANLGIYHVKKPLTWNKAGLLATEDTRILFFYHNRMKGYDLEKYV
jgi:glycerol-3-phosphate O-acyltransferase